MRTYCHADFLDGTDLPHSVFQFKYRSREALKSLLIIERTPSPSPESERASADPLNVNNLDAEQKKKLERFLQDLTVRAIPSWFGPVTNDYSGQGNDTPSRTIKRERNNDRNSESSRKKRISGKSVVIDLTDD